MFWGPDIATSIWLRLSIGHHLRLIPMSSLSCPLRAKAAARILHSVALNPHSVVLVVIVVMIFIIPIKQPIARIILVIFLFLLLNVVQLIASSLSSF